MMDRRRFVGFGTGLLAGASDLVPAFAQSRAPLVAFVSAVARNAEHSAALEKGLRESGLDPGRTVEIVERHADGNLDTMKRHIDELVALKPAVFVTAGDNAMRLIQERAPDAPIVVAVLGNYGNVVVGGSIARPPGNVTGFSNLSAELATKRLSLLREIVPDLKHCALLINPAVANPTGQPQAYGNGAAVLGLKLTEVKVEADNDLTAALTAAKDAGVRGLVVYRNFRFETRRADIIAAIGATTLPSMFEERFYVDGGGLISYSPNLTDLFQRSAAYVAKILKGAKPGDLPIQLPTAFDTILNLKTAKTLGLTIPPSLLTLANETIE